MRTQSVSKNIKPVKNGEHMFHGGSYDVKDEIVEDMVEIRLSSDIKGESLLLTELNTSTGCEPKFNLTYVFILNLWLW